MGPHFFKCGKAKLNSHSAQNPARFNGAALFQVRKVPLLRRLCFRLATASMGPHFFKCGKKMTIFIMRNGHHGFNGAALFQVRKAT